MSDTLAKRKGFDKFIQKVQPNLESFDDFLKASEPERVNMDKLLGHLSMEEGGIKEGDPKLVVKVQKLDRPDIEPAKIQYDKTWGKKELGKDTFAHYDPSQKSILLNPRELALDDLSKASTVRHENEHYFDDLEGKKSIPIKEFSDEKLAEFVKNNPKASKMDLEEFMKSVKNYGMEGEAAASLGPAAARELEVTLHHPSSPRGFEATKVYDILKGAGNKAKVIGQGITKIGAKVGKGLPVVGAIAGLASGDASAAIPGMWSEDVGAGSDEVPQMSKPEWDRFRVLKEKLESEE
jgi:hypothetical protein